MSETKTYHCEVCNEDHPSNRMGCYVKDMRRVDKLERRLEGLARRVEGMISPAITKVIEAQGRLMPFNPRLEHVAGYCWCGRGILCPANKARLADAERAVEAAEKSTEVPPPMTPAEVAIWGRNEVDRIHSEPHEGKVYVGLDAFLSSEADKPVSVCRACDLRLYGATCTCGKAKPADMLGEVLEMLERTKCLLLASRLYGKGGSAMDSLEAVMRAVQRDLATREASGLRTAVERRKREADALEEHACAMCGKVFLTASGRDAHLATACPMMKREADAREKRG